MTAKEMFEELNFHLQYTDDYFIEYKNNDTQVEVNFDKFMSKVTVNGGFNDDLCKAIAKQFEEIKVGRC